MTKFPTLSYTYTPYPSYTWILEMVKSKASRKVYFKLVYKIYYLIQLFSYDFEVKMREQNRNNKRSKIERFDSLVERIQTRVRFGWLSKRLAEKLSRNQSILRFDIIPQHDWPIEQCLLHTEIFFGRKTRSLCLIFHPLGDKTNNELLPKPFFEVIRKSLYSSTGCCSSRLKRIRKLLR